MFNLCFGILWARTNWHEETNPSQDHVLDMLFSRDMGQTWQTARTVLNAAQFVLLVKPHIFHQKKEVGFYNYPTPHSLKASNIIKCVTHQTSPYIQNCTPRALTCFFPESCLKKQVHPMFPKKTRNHILVVGFDPFEKYLSKWDPSPNRGENKSNLKPPPSIWETKHIQPPK